MKLPLTWLSVLVFILSACAAPSEPTPLEDEIHPELKNIPIYPNSTAWSEGIPGVSRQPKKLQTYSYLAAVFNYETLTEFYEEEMPETGWELLQRSRDAKNNSADLMFAKSKTVAHLQIIPWTANSYLACVVFYDDAPPEE